MSRLGTLLLCLFAVFAPACRSLSRDFNNSLPGIFRSEPGKDELERLAVLKRGRVEITPEEKAARAAQVADAKKAYEEGRYGDAASQLDDFLKDHPGTEYDEECRFLWAEALYRDDDFSGAYGAYKSYATNYPVSNRGPVVEERLYDVGRDYLDGNRSSFFGIFSNRSKGLEILDYLVTTYPNAERADDAKWLVARYHVDDEEWDKATVTFDFLVEQYKQSEWYPAAKWFSGYCRYRRVKGDRYDPEVIARARRIFVEYLKENPAGQWRAQAEEIVAELDVTASERMLKIGYWYLDQGKPYSARFYFLRVKQLWPQSEAAKRAEAEYAAVAGATPETPEEELALKEEFERRNARMAADAGAGGAASRPESGPASMPAGQGGR